MAIRNSLLFDDQMTQSQVATTAPQVAWVWGATPAYVATYKQNNASILTGLYAVSFIDWGGISAGLGRTLAWWQANHPSWVLYQSDQVTPAFQSSGGTIYPDIPLDPNNNDATDFLAQQQISQLYFTTGSPPTYDEINLDLFTMDNLNGGVGIFSSPGVWSPLYSGAQIDSIWAAAARKFIQRYALNLTPGSAVGGTPKPTIYAFVTKQLGVVPNLESFAQSPPNSDYTALLTTNIKGFLDEAAWTGFGTSRLADQAWLDRATWYRQVQNANLGGSGAPGLHVDCQTDTGTRPNQPSVSDRRWVLACHLLTTDGPPTLRLYGTIVGGAQATGTYITWPEFQALVGTPNGLMFSDQGCQARKYTSGYAVANISSTTTQTYILPTGFSWADAITGAITTGVTLGPTEGAVYYLNPQPSNPGTTADPGSPPVTGGGAVGPSSVGNPATGTLPGTLTGQLGSLRTAQIIRAKPPKVGGARFGDDTSMGGVVDALGDVPASPLTTPGTPSQVTGQQPSAKPLK